ncbi:saccharopine dehydrogenase NADP-binding domain-containing protein [Brevibacillus marinus]|uniref:L-erythro-3,5-diaminohexanoate dehydrogenase n=1 Tax=Brevibacillus marinus TaxID=2496837 RepID=UPI000F82AAB3|nr:saccharopine dehydrogenase NADP-binding domain-containing protein [Brevibacillus marinus]
MKRGCAYGTHRVLEPLGVLPQAAYKLDNQPAIFSNEICIDVNLLTISATAFAQLKKRTHGEPTRIAEEIMHITRERGKFQCPQTGAGGMLTGVVEKIGPDLAGKVELKEGDPVATLVSLSLTPLYLEEVREIFRETDQVRVKGKAILFASGIYTRLPADIPERVSVAVMDVAGAPAWTAKYVKAGDYVVVIGAGKAGLLCLHEAKKRAGVTGKVIAIDPSARQCERITAMELADIVIQADATQPVAVLEQLRAATGGRLADFVVNTVNVAGTEMASILVCRDHGCVLFFSMSTDFAKAALGCEGVGKVVTMLIGSGYTEGHAEITYQILQENPKLKEYFLEVYQ